MARAQAAAAPVPRDTFNAWMQRVSNTGRWGPDDQLGTLNLITPETRRAAARLVRDGVSVSLASDLVSGNDANRVFPLRVRLGLHTFDSTVLAIDSVWLMTHGFEFSHVDALAHIAFRDQLYNGIRTRQLVPEGATKLGVEVMHAGIVTRGVLVDIPRLKNLPFLESGTAVTVADLEAWEQRHQTRIGPGDVVLIRTGRATRLAATGGWRVSEDASGPHPSVALWLRERRVAALGGDVGNEAAPSVVAGIALPMHLLAITAMGMPLFDNLDLERLAIEAAGRARPTFLFVAAPLRVRGSTGSPVNPLAIF